MTLQVDGIDPQPPIDGGTLSVRFTLSNPTDTALVGDVLAVLQNQPLTSADPTTTSHLNRATTCRDRFLRDGLSQFPQFIKAAGSSLAVDSPSSS